MTVRVGGDTGTDGARVIGGAPTVSAGAAASGWRAGRGVLTNVTAVVRKSRCSSSDGVAVLRGTAAARGPPEQGVRVLVLKMGQGL